MSLPRKIKLILIAVVGLVAIGALAIRLSWSRIEVYFSGVHQRSVTQSLREWGHEPGGALKPLRVLITSLPTVLWEGANWEPVPMAKLVVAAKVKVFFHKFPFPKSPNQSNNRLSN